MTSAFGVVPIEEFVTSCSRFRMTGRTRWCVGRILGPHEPTILILDAA